MSGPGRKWGGAEGGPGPGSPGRPAGGGRPYHGRRCYGGHPEPSAQWEATGLRLFFLDTLVYPFLRGILWLHDLLLARLVAVRCDWHRYSSPSWCLPTARAL